QPFLFGNRPRGFPTELVAGLLGGRSATPIRIGGLTIDRVDVLVVGVTILLAFLLRLLVLRTRWGLAMRAVSDRPDAAALMGVDPDRVIGSSFALGGA